MADQFPKVKVAAFHGCSVFLDRKATTEKACSVIAEAGRNGARLVVFPESFIPGYPFWIWYKSPTDGAPLFYDFFTNAVEIPSATTDALCQAAREAGCYVVMGLNERDGGTLYNTLLFIDDNGNIIGRHRKLQPTHVERTVWGRGDGSDIVVVDTPFGKLGGLICWEHSMDLLRHSLIALGEQIHVAAWPGVSQLTHNPHSAFFNDLTEAVAKYHAFAGQTFVINVQSCIDEATIERLGLSGQPEMIRPGGGWSAIVAPDTQIIAGPVTEEETLLYGQLDLADIVMMKYACDSIGHYARPDVLQLKMNLNPQTVLYNGPTQESSPRKQQGAYQREESSSWQQETSREPAPNVPQS